MAIAVLMACHERRETTRLSLCRLYASLDAAKSVEAGVFLVDDGSSDGTGEMVRREFPEVRVTEGDGSLYWSRGMRMAWTAARKEREDWDGYLWLNDDTELRPDAMSKMLAANDGERIVVGELEDSKGEIVYGLREGGLFTGNCVFVPRNVYARLGMLCGDYSHAWADYDYAMQAKRSGVEVVSAGVVGKAEGHPNRPSLTDLPLTARWRLLSDPKGWNLHDLWLYRRRNWGVARAMVSCFHLVIHVIWGGR